MAGIEKETIAFAYIKLLWRYQYDSKHVSIDYTHTYSVSKRRKVIYNFYCKSQHRECSATLQTCMLF